MCDRNSRRTSIWVTGATDLTQSLRFIKQAVSKDGWEIDMTARTRLSRLCANLMLFHPTLHFILITTPFRLNLAENLFLIAEVLRTRRDLRLPGWTQLHMACQMKFMVPAPSTTKALPLATIVIFVHKSHSGLAGPCL
jgi:hypothetical protein